MKEIKWNTQPKQNNQKKKTQSKSTLHNCKNKMFGKYFSNLHDNDILDLIEKA